MRRRHDRYLPRCLPHGDSEYLDEETHGRVTEQQNGTASSLGLPWSVESY